MTLEDNRIFREGTYTAGRVLIPPDTPVHYVGFGDELVLRCSRGRRGRVNRGAGATAVNTICTIFPGKGYHALDIIEGADNSLSISSPNLFNGCRDITDVPVVIGSTIEYGGGLGSYCELEDIIPSAQLFVSRKGNALALRGHPEADREVSTRVYVLGAYCVEEIYHPLHALEPAVKPWWSRLRLPHFHQTATV